LIGSFHTRRNLQISDSVLTEGNKILLDEKEKKNKSSFSIASGAFDEQAAELDLEDV